MNDQNSKDFFTEVNAWTPENQNTPLAQLRPESSVIPNSAPFLTSFTSKVDRFHPSLPTSSRYFCELTTGDPPGYKQMMLEVLTVTKDPPSTASYGAFCRANRVSGNELWHVQTLGTSCVLRQGELVSSKGDRALIP